MATTDELLVALMRNCKNPVDLIRDNGLLQQLLAKTMERSNEVEMTEQPDGYLRQNESGG